VPVTGAEGARAAQPPVPVRPACHCPGTSSRSAAVRAHPTALVKAFTIWADLLGLNPSEVRPARSAPAFVVGALVREQ
jgi:hypothetical protein